MAQEQVVTDDEVNAIAKKLYCPVCENIPLDTCGTAACQDWRYEIRLQLEQDMTEEQIIDDFVRRFGDRVVGTPRDPVLHALSVATPYIAFVLATIVALYMLLQYRTRRIKKDSLPYTSSEEPVGTTTDRYQDILEQDLSG